MGRKKYNIIPLDENNKELYATGRFDSNKEAKRKAEEKGIKKFIIRRERGD